VPGQIPRRPALGVPIAAVISRITGRGRSCPRFRGDQSDQPVRRPAPMLRPRAAGGVRDRRGAQAGGPAHASRRTANGSTRPPPAQAGTPRSTPNAVTIGGQPRAVPRHRAGDRRRRAAAAPTRSARADPAGLFRL